MGVARAVDGWLEALPKKESIHVLIELARLSSGANRKLIVSRPLHPGEPDEVHRPQENQRDEEPSGLAAEPPNNETDAMP